MSATSNKAKPTLSPQEARVWRVFGKQRTASVKRLYQAAKDLRQSNVEPSAVVARMQQQHVGVLVARINKKLGVKIKPAGKDRPRTYELTR